MELECNRCTETKKELFNMDKNELLNIIHKLKAKMHVASKLLEIAVDKNDLYIVHSAIELLVEKGE